MEISYISKSSTINQDGFVTDNREKTIKYQAKIEYLDETYLYDYETVLK